MGTSLDNLKTIGNPHFEGYSPNEKDELDNNPFGENSLVQFRELSDELLMDIPILRQVKYFLNLIKELDGLKLTVKGNIPIKIVREIYELGIRDPYVDDYSENALFEQRSYSVGLTRAILSVGGFVKKRYNRLELTKSGVQIQKKSLHALFIELLRVRCTVMNWTTLEKALEIDYNDYELGDCEIGTIGWVYSLILVSKYGDSEQGVRLYIEKFFDAYPLLVDNYYAYHKISQGNEEYSSSFCSYLFVDRMFYDFMLHFGLIEIKENGAKFDLNQTIIKTPLFDKLIDILPPKKVITNRFQ